MNTYTTIIKAIDPKDGKLKIWGGPCVQGITFEDAQNYCDKNDLGYCEVEDELLYTVDQKPGTLEPDLKTKIYYTQNLN